MLIAIFGFLINVVFIGHLVYQLKTGKLYDRRWRAFTNHRENPMLYWSSIAVEALIALMVLSVWVLLVAS